MTTTVGVRDLKNSLSRWLRLVRNGESVIVLDRGRPIAVLSAAVEHQAPTTVAEHLASLAARGLLTLGTGRRLRRSKRFPRVNLSDALTEDREDKA